MTVPVIDFFEALGSPTRMAIIILLIEAEEPMSVKDIAKAVGYSQANISRGLSQLKKARAVEVESKANQRLYTITKGLPELLAVAASLVC